MKQLMMKLLVPLLVVPAFSSVAFAENVVLKYSSWLPPTHYVNTESILPFAAEVEKATQGRVKIEVQPKVVGPVASQYDVCVDGLADICIPVLGYTPGRFPLASIGELPFKNFDSVYTDGKFHDFYMSTFGDKNEFKGVKVLSLFPFSGHNLFLKNKDINSVSDFNGLKIRVSGNNSVELLKSLGGVPVLKPVTEVYELLSTGAIDGVVTSDEGLKTNNFADVVNNVVVIPGGFTDSVFALVINEAKWAAISPEDQKAIEALAGGKVGESIGKAAKAANQRGIDLAKEKNIPVKTLSAEAFAGMKEKAKPVDDAWIAAAEKAGVTNAGEILTKFREDMAKGM